MREDTQFYKELTDVNNIFNFNGKPMSRAHFNLILSKRDLGLWKAGMKPTRGWKVTNVKKYFGFTGHDRTKLYEQCCKLLEEVRELKELKKADMKTKKIKDLAVIVMDGLDYFQGSRFDELKSDDVFYIKAFIEMIGVLSEELKRKL